VIQTIINIIVTYRDNHFSTENMRKVRISQFIKFYLPIVQRTRCQM